MEENVFGEYCFANFYEVNMDTPSQIGNQTTLHEAFHMIFTLQSPYGNFIHMHQRLSNVEKRFIYINSILAKHCRQVQEAACVFAEITYIVCTQSFESAIQYIQMLRTNNREYFNYLSPLCPFLKFTKENKNNVDSYKFSMIEMFSIVKSIVLISLDVDLTQLDLDVFYKGKRLDRSIAMKLCPNRIFRDTVKQVLDIFKQNTAPEKIRKDLLEFVIKYTPVYDKKALCFTQEKHRQFFEKLYYDSPNYQVLMDILSRFTIKELKPVDILGSGIPTTDKPQYHQERGNKEDIIKRSEEDAGVLFVLGEAKSIATELLLKWPQHYRNGFCITFLDYVRKKQYSALFDLEQANQLCKSMTVPIVVNYKAYHTIRRKILHAPRVPVFAYCDRSYKNAVEIIRSYANTEKPFKLVSYQKNMGCEVLLIELEQGFYFLLPMMKTSLYCLFQDIQSGTLKLKEELTVDDDLLYFVDTVINCIFYY